MTFNPLRHAGLKAKLMLASGGLMLLFIWSLAFLSAHGLQVEIASQPGRHIQHWIFGLAALLTVCGGWLSYRLVDRLLKPLDDANRAMQCMIGGRMPLHALPGGRKDEIGQLVESFNCLVEERKSYEARLQQLSKVVEQSPASILITDLDGTIEYVNEAFVCSTGYSTDEAVGQNARFLKSGHTPADTYAELWQALSQGLPWQGEMINRRKNGEVYREATRFAPIRQVDGRISHYLAIKEDVTAQRRLEEELDQHRHRLEQLVAARTAELERANQQLRINDARLRVTLELTKKADELSETALLRAWIDETVCLTGSRFGHLSFLADDARSFLPTTWSTAISSAALPLPDPLPLTGAGIWASPVRQAGPVIDNAFAATAGAGDFPGIEQPPQRVLGVPIIADGRVRLILGVADKESDYEPADVLTLQKFGHDLWRTLTRRRAEIALREAKQAAESAARAKMDFLANMSHEIRTPMNAVLGLARIGVRENHGRQTSQTSARILEASRHLLGVINDILDFSKIEAGKLSVESHPFALPAALRDAVDLVAERATAKGLALNVSLPPDLTPWVVGDSLRLKQILVNLLSNAIKFTEHGEVRLEVSSIGQAYSFRVSDTGIGMSETEMTRLFQPFEQADASTTRKYGGTGLGLAISDQLAQLMGGEIAVDSRPASGSTFTLRLRLATGSAPEDSGMLPADHRHAGLAGLRVLAVEDVAVNRFILEDLLTQEGLYVSFAENGQAALDLVHEQGSKAYDVVLMDIQMPVMDGLEATRRLRLLAPDLPVIGLTAHAFAEERERCLAAGMVAHVSKPIEPSVLFETIENCLDAAARDNEQPGPGPAADIPAPSAATIAEHDPHHGRVIDFAGLLERFNGRHGFIARLAGILCEQHAATPEKLLTAVDARDFATLAFIGHSLKGMGANLGARALQQLAGDVERAARAGEDAASELARKLATMIEATIGECATFLARGA